MTISEFEGEYDFLSNFFMFPVNYNNILYPSNEHAYQAEKSFWVEDKVRISKLKTPGEAKRAGRSVSLRPDWEEIKYNVMLDICRQKFLNPNLKIKLLLTGDSYLEEGNNWHDNYWGVCRCKKCPNVGQNNLGEILMQIREEIKIA